MVRTIVAIESEIVNAKSIRDAGTSKRKEGQLSSSSGNDRRLLFPEDYKDRAEAIKAKVRVEAIRAKARVGA